LINSVNRTIAFSCIFVDFFSKEELLKECAYYFDAISETSYFVENLKMSTDEWVRVCMQRDKSEQVQVLPFYSVIDDKTLMVPMRLNYLISTSNGLAAGNTMEEAVVEGVSEIVERYNRTIITKERLVPPTIPDDYLEQFTAAYEIITDLRKAGYDVLIKDYSLGEGYPVIAAVVIDKKSHSYHVHVGANPVFEIALQRSLTEMFQGREISSVAKIHKVSLKKNLALSIRDILTIYSKGIGEYPIEFFDGEPSYSFSAFENRENCNNRELLAYVTEYIKSKNKKLLIRDLSLFGFNTYRIIIPGMSELKFYMLSEELKDSFPLLSLGAECSGLSCDITSYSPDELFSYETLNRYRVGKGFIDPCFSKMHYIPSIGNDRVESFYGNIDLAYAKWECMDRTGACEFAKKAMRYADEESEGALSCICSLTSLYSKDVITKELNQLKRFYNAETIEMLRSDLENDKNPFERLVLKCTPENCESCKNKANCTVELSYRVRDLIDKASFEFDNEAAVQRLREGFAFIRSV
ncbi:MAG: YcaO-like family protein, partial [Ruminococcus sp.]